MSQRKDLRLCISSFRLYQGYILPILLFSDERVLSDCKWDSFKCKILCFVLITWQNGKYFVVDFNGNMIKICGKDQKGFDTLEGARYMAAMYRQSLSLITDDQ